MFGGESALGAGQQTPKITHGWDAGVCNIPCWPGKGMGGTNIVGDADAVCENPLTSSHEGWAASGIAFMVVSSALIGTGGDRDMKHAARRVGNHNGALGPADV